MLEILLVILFIGIIISSYFLCRNDKVCTFRCTITNLEYARTKEAIHQGLHHEYRNLHDKYTYDQMLYSIKPLKLKYWFTEEEIHYLTKSLNR